MGSVRAIHEVGVRFLSAPPTNDHYELHRKEAWGGALRRSMLIGSIKPKSGSTEVRRRLGITSCNITIEKKGLG